MTKENLERKLAETDNRVKVPMTSIKQLKINVVTFKDYNRLLQKIILELIAKITEGTTMARKT